MPPGASKGQVGCTDSSPPTHSVGIQLPFPITFGGGPPVWQRGGVAFLELPGSIRRSGGLDFSGPVWDFAHPTWPRAMGRMYRITREQFLEIVAQENQLGSGAPGALINLDRLGETQFEPIETSGAYDTAICLGLCRFPEWRGELVVTFTNGRTEVTPEWNPPSIQYLRTILRGLIETFPDAANEEFVRYIRFMCAPGGDSRVESDARYRAIDGSARSDFAALVAQYRAESGVANPEGYHVSVGATTGLAKQQREVRAVFHPETSLDAGLREGDLIRLSRPTNWRSHFDPETRRFQIVEPIRATTQDRFGASLRLAVPAMVETADTLARANPDSVPSPGIAQLDQKLRLALGVNIGDVIRVESRPVPRRNPLARAFDRLIGTRAQFARVDLATFEDMETSICRLPPSVFEVLGISPGDHVRISSVGHRQVVIRAVEITEGQRTRRQEQHTRVPHRYPDPYKQLDLQRVEYVTPTVELPTIYLDAAARQELGVPPSGVVRVRRAVRQNLGFRGVLVVGPAFLVGAELSADPVLAIIVALFVALVLAVLVGFELRQKIS
ncbi:MAG: hypothetical protein AAGB51_04585 [Planctomycetota bacterium]